MKLAVRIALLMIAFITGAAFIATARSNSPKSDTLGAPNK